MSGEVHGILSTERLQSQKFGAIEDSQPEDHRRGCCSLIPKRFIVAFMALFGFANIYALRVNLSVAIIDMVANKSKTLNGTVVWYREFDWDMKYKGIILSAFFYGYIVTQLPGGFLSERVGGRLLFGLGVTSTAVMTLVTPAVARLGPLPLVALRILEGLCEGVTYPSIHAVWAHWAPNQEKTKLATVAFSGSYIGTVIAMPLSAIIAEKLGWAPVFYIFGSAALLWSVCWFVLVAETPSKHTTITAAELEYIRQNTDGPSSSTSHRVPWGSILRSPRVWAVVVAHFSENWGFYTLLTLLPTFMHDVLHFDITKAGFVSALPYLVMAVVLQVAGNLADWLRGRDWSTTRVRKLFTCSAFVNQTVFLVVTGYMSAAGPSVACLTLAVGIGGFAWAGFSVNHLDLAPKYASVLMGLSNTFATIPGMVSPALAGVMVKDKTAAEWRGVFYLAAAIYLLGALVFGLLGSGEREPWAEADTPYVAHEDDVDIHYHDSESDEEDVLHSL